MAQQPLKSEKKDQQLERELSISPEFDTAYDLLLAQDYIQAVTHLKAAAEQGYPPAFAELLSIYGYGCKDVPKDSKQASHWLAKSKRSLDWCKAYSAKGDWRANACLGYFYREGLGVRKDLIKSLQCFDAALKQQPKNTVLLCSLGTVLFDLEQPKQALVAYDAALVINPQHADAHYGRGVTLGRLGRLAEALAALDAALAIDPQQAATHYSRGVTLGRLGRLAEALAAFDAALAIKPQYAVAHYDRGVTLSCLGRHADALVAYDAALAIDFQYIDAHHGRGEVLTDLGRHADALVAYDAALAINPQQADTHHNRGLVLNRLGRHADALAAYDAALAINPQQAVTHHSRGELLNDLGQRTNAINAYLAALAIDENRPTTKIKLQEITGISYETYKAQKMQELSTKLASVAGEIGMFRREQKETGTIKMGSQTEEAQLLKIILGYAVCPPETEKEESSAKEEFKI